MIHKIILLSLFLSSSLNAEENQDLKPPPVFEPISYSNNLTGIGFDVHKFIEGKSMEEIKRNCDLFIRIKYSEGESPEFTAEEFVFISGVKDMGKHFKDRCVTWHFYNYVDSNVYYKVSDFSHQFTSKQALKIVKESRLNELPPKFKGELIVGASNYEIDLIMNGKIHTLRYAITTNEHPNEKLFSQRLKLLIEKFNLKSNSFGIRNYAITR
ncbi:hypothetical protein OAB00_03740 [Akkermansiaceae bacterium]|nr:hypothetical protein [Akkermansiaceae bacterium]